ncbi:MAG: hypothetical protein NTV46_04035 [Verrucomicrobia bacterium]|nr:hypothetical protein [Verrucomicrobiota bacterium]
MSWFAGASVGYLTELEEPMYTVHLGITNSCWMIGGWNVGLFAEVGYTDSDYSDSWLGIDEHNFAYNGERKIDFSIVPITANVKLERALSGNLNAYVGAGLGIAWIDADMRVTREYKALTETDRYSDSDWVFTAQIFAGLSYSMSQACEIFGGARWIYYADPEFGGKSIDVQDDWLFELGTRFKF